MEKIACEIADGINEKIEGIEKDEIFQPCDVIREVSYAIHEYLRQGHLAEIGDQETLSIHQTLKTINP